MPTADSSRCSRRELLLQAATGSAALGALSALPSRDATGQETKTVAQDVATPAGASQVTDFERSCLRFRIDTTKKPVKTVSRKLPMTLNNVRMALDARARILHKASGKVSDYVLSASCKSEQVWVERDVWHQPNADMCMIAGPGEFLVFKRWDKTDKGILLFPPSLGVQPERQLDNPDECFDRFSIDRVTRAARKLEKLDEILETLFSGSPVVGHTEYDTGEYQVLLEYPVRVVNFSERERYYQVDTGPILLPEFGKSQRSLIEGCRLAYVAHNRPEWAEFIVCVPTPLNEQIKVHHYSESIRFEGTKNTLFAV